MSKIFFILILFCSTIFAQGWQFEKQVTLHKDQFYVVYITRDGVRKLFYFRWTLNKNEGLVMHFSYDRFNNQFMLYQDRVRDTFKLELFPKDTKEYMPPYLLLKYDGFNYEAKSETQPKGTANFSVFVKDMLSNITVDNIEDVKEIIKQEVENDNKDKKQN